MAENQTNKQRLKEITDSIEANIQELFQSEKYMNYLRTMSRFHKYSFNNTMLIHMQKPDATLVTGYNKWEQKFNRHVRRGEKGIKIIAPTPFKKKIEQEKLDPDTKLPMRDNDGNIILEEKEVKIPMYKPVVVFDVSQTEGEPLPTLSADLRGDVKHYEIFMEALRRSAPVPVEFEMMAENMDGYFSRDNQRIAIREGMSEVQTICAAVHEITHAKLHNVKEKLEIDNTEQYEEIELFDKPALFSNERIDREKLPAGLYCYDLRGGDDDPGAPVTVEAAVVVNRAGSVILAEPLDFGGDDYLALGEDMNFIGSEATLKHFYEQMYPDKVEKDRNTEEVEAESVSFAVCSYYGIETGENSFGYIASWSKGMELKELRASLETINRTADGLITDIDRNFTEICKERGIDLSNEQLGTVPTIPGESVSGDGKAPEVEPDKQFPPEDEILIDTTLDEPPVPDSSISESDMQAFGYADTDMLPVSRERAIELMERDLPVYMLYSDNTEAMAFEPEELSAHDGMFGIAVEDWRSSEAFEKAVNDRLNHQQEREAAFLNHAGDSFAIYQLKLDDSSLTDIRYMPMDYLEGKGMEPHRDNYELVYTGELSEGCNLNALWEQFNNDHPADYMRPSMSVSDIVAIRKDGVVSCHYVDSFGFQELPNFLQPENHLKSAEMAVEDDYNMVDGIINNGPKQPTVAELEEQAKNGQPISLLDLAEAVQRENAEKRQSPAQEKKPSILAKIRQPLPAKEEKKTAPDRSAEKEYLR